MEDETLPTDPPVEASVLPHPDADTVEVPIAKPPPPPEEPPPEEPPCCPLRQVPIFGAGEAVDYPPPYLMQPNVAIDVRDLSATLIGTFVLGATVAFALAYFSRRGVSTDA